MLLNSMNFNAKSRVALNAAVVVFCPEAKVG
jgi:hypothetical protein